MKLRLLISILFIIATTAVAVHELEHIKTGGSSSSCQVCVVDDHSISADIVDDFKDIVVFRFEQIAVTNIVYSLHTKNHSYQNHAPPIKS